MAMMGVFIDTFVILTLTALVILSSGALSSGQNRHGLAQAAFHASFGYAGDVFIAVCILFFAFSTIIGWYFFGQSNVKAFIRQEGHQGLRAAGRPFSSSSDPPSRWIWSGIYPTCSTA